MDDPPEIMPDRDEIIAELAILIARIETPLLVAYLPIIQRHALIRPRRQDHPDQMPNLRVVCFDHETP